MSASKPAAKPATKKFKAALERTNDRLNWVIARVPFDVAKVWGKRGHLRVQGDINGFSFSTTLFPTGKGEHFLIVNKKMQSGGKTAPGMVATLQLAPDTLPRRPAPPSSELLRELSQSKRLLKFYESVNNSWRNEIARRIAQGKHESTRVRRAQQFAEQLMETMEAERELPPMMQMVFRQNPLAREKWEGMSVNHRRRHLLSVFYYREPESRARRFAKAVDEMLGRARKSRTDEADLDD
ncbi:MAG TPA: YdeI/OmpD-associated family protein [Candidatus Sulfotelmatobacter sp.]|nr:YdeI/OmpD-associated family protein [Candidatus Sulfotelmatobacter sp.]